MATYGYGDVRKFWRQELPKRIAEIEKLGIMNEKEVEWLFSHSDDIANSYSLKGKEEMVIDPNKVESIRAFNLYFARGEGEEPNCRTIKKVLADMLGVISEQIKVKDLPGLLRSLIDIERALKFNRFVDESPKYWVAYFHRSRGEKFNGVLKHPRINWVVLARGCLAELTPSALRYRKKYGIPDAERVEIFDNREKQLLSIYEFFYRRTLDLKIEVVKEYDDSIKILADKPGLAIGKEGAAIKFLSEVVGKKIKLVK